MKGGEIEDCVAGDEEKDFKRLAVWLRLRCGGLFRQGSFPHRFASLFRNTFDILEVRIHCFC